VGDTGQSNCNEDGCWDQGKEDLLELDGEIEIVATSSYGRAERVIVDASREI
jgi:hypothetical protein